MDEVIREALQQYPWFLPIAVVSIPYGLAIRYFIKDRDFWRTTALRALNVGEAVVKRGEHDGGDDDDN